VIISRDDVTEPWGIGALVLAALFAIASLPPLRGSRIARILLAALAVASGGLALVYVFAGPSSEIPASLVTAAMAAMPIWLLYGPRSAPEVARRCCPTNSAE
jgi:drug/metabolite transporter (DMT)-like permease